MKTKIENITQLREEIKLLKQEKTALEEQLKDDYEDLKDLLSPLGIVSEVLSGIAGLRIGSGIFTAAGFANELKSILRQILIRGGTTFFAKRVYTMVFNLVGRIFHRKKKRNPEDNHH